MTRSRALIGVITVALSLLAACGSNATPKPPAPLATPKNVDELTGIWRSVHQNTLELRKNGTFVLISPATNAMAGDYTLSNDKMTFSNTKGCSGDGTYRVQSSVKGRIELSQPDDPCPPRKLALSDPFIYAQPDFS